MTEWGLTSVIITGTQFVSSNVSTNIKLSTMGHPKLYSEGIPHAANTLVVESTQNSAHLQAVWWAMCTLNVHRVRTGLGLSFVCYNCACVQWTSSFTIGTRTLERRLTFTFKAIALNREKNRSVVKPSSHHNRAIESHRTAVVTMESSSSYTADSRLPP